MSKVLIIGCGGVASVAIHKCCQVPEVFTEICIASRTKSKCDKLAAELAPKTATKITTAQVDADKVDEVIALIKAYRPDLVMNIALPYQDLTIMDACLACGVNYMDTANYEPENTDLDEKLQQLMNKLEADSSVKTGMTLNIAINYGGRPEIVRAAQQLAAKAAAGEIKPEEITEQLLSDAMYTAGQKDPDFILRPSGEKRLSNFMLWQAAYSELVEMDVLWPDFTRSDLDAAIEEFNHRSRRFGGL